MVVGLEGHRIPAFKAVEFWFLLYFRLEKADRGRFLTSCVLIAPFLRPNRLFPELRTHLSPQCRKNDLLEVVRHADQGELPRHFLPAPHPESPKSRVLDLSENPAPRSSCVARRSLGSPVSTSARSWPVATASFPSLVIVRAAPDFDRQQRR